MSDLINRQDAIRAVANYFWHYPNEQYKNLNVFEIAESLAKDALSTVPSADRPTGEWIEDKYCDRHCICSNCGGSSGTQFDGVQLIPLKTKFCPNCGADMNEARADDDE